MGFKIITMLAIELILLISLWCLKKTYRSDTLLLFLSDYELIEQLPYRQRKEYLEKSFQIVKILIYNYLILFPICILISNIILIILGVIIIISFYLMYKSYQLQKEYKKYINVPY